MRIEPAGHRVIVKPDPLSELEQKEMQQYAALKNSGFEIAEQGDKKRKESAIHTGTIMAIGKTAWKAFDDGEPWAVVGDRVHFAKFGGYVFEENGEKYRLLNDEDITAIVREGAAIGLLDQLYAIDQEAVNQLLGMEAAHAIADMIRDLAPAGGAA